MDAEWSVAAAEDDPVLAIPWSDPSQDGEPRKEGQPSKYEQLSYIDLRSDPSLVDRLPEARAWPEMRTALLQLNGPASAVWTAKCDAWELSEEERQLDFGAVDNGFGAYFDLLSRDLGVFSSLEKHIDFASSLATAAHALSPSEAATSFIVRPAQWRHTHGFAITVYVYGYGEQPTTARAQWSEAIRTVIRLILAAK
jgi:hypothetical protein